MASLWTVSTSIDVATARIWLFDEESTYWGGFYSYTSGYWTNYVDWTISEYNTTKADGYSFVTADITSLIQTAIAFGWWSCNSDLNFQIQPLTGDTSNYDIFYSHLDGSYYPILTINASLVGC